MSDHSRFVWRPGDIVFLDEEDPIPALREPIREQREEKRRHTTTPDFPLGEVLFVSQVVNRLSGAATTTLGSSTDDTGDDK